jgi:haloalkane dehalogenase
VHWKGQKHRIDVEGLSMAHVERGTGDPIVFLHGNPTSSYLWRNIIPHLEVRGRCIAPDLIGMGDSEKLLSSGPGRYRFVEHRAYLDGLLAGLGVTERVILVVHDWGSALGFDWARRHPGAVRGIAYMEAIMAPLRQPLGEPFASLRSAAGEQMVLQDNLFIERLLPSGMLRQLTPSEHDEYRRPYLVAGESRRPTLSWPREIPAAGTPADVVKIVEEYAAWLSASRVPKLFIRGEPGMVIVEGGWLELCRGLPNQTEVTVHGLHFLQEDSPDDVGGALATWVDSLSP